MAKPKARANGTGTAYKRGKTWTVEVVVGYKAGSDGAIRPIRKTKGGYRTKSEALAAAESLMNSGHSEPEKRKVTIDSLYQSYMPIAARKISESKLCHYRTARKKIDDIAYVDIRKLSIDDLQNMVDGAAPTFYPAKDIKTLLSQLYDRAVADRVVPTNLAKYIVLPPLSEKPTVPFSDSEVLLLWDAWQAGDIMCGYALLMIYTGMMPGELCELRTDMIDFPSQTIVGCGLKTKVRKDSPIILPDIIIPLLKDLCEEAKDGKILPFRYDAFCAEFREMIDRYHLRKELRPYSCRHTTATTLATADTPLLTIKYVMRHSRVTTTQRYVHMDTTPLIDAANHAYNANSTPNVLPTSDS